MSDTRNYYIAWDLWHSAAENESVVVVPQEPIVVRDYCQKEALWRALVKAWVCINNFVLNDKYTGISFPGLVSIACNGERPVDLPLKTVAPVPILNDVVQGRRVWFFTSGNLTGLEGARYKDKGLCSSCLSFVAKTAKWKSALEELRDGAGEMHVAGENFGDMFLHLHDNKVFVTLVNATFPVKESNTGFDRGGLSFHADYEKMCKMLA